jgi:hypothetical protein
MGNQTPKYLPKNITKEQEEEMRKASEQSIAIETQNLINDIERCISRKDSEMKELLFQPTIDRLRSVGYKLECKNARPHDPTDLEQRCTIYCNK